MLHPDLSPEGRTTIAAKHKISHTPNSTKRRTADELVQEPRDEIDGTSGCESKNQPKNRKTAHSPTMDRKQQDVMNVVARDEKFIFSTGGAGTRRKRRRDRAENWPRGRRHPHHLERCTPRKRFKTNYAQSRHRP